MNIKCPHCGTEYEVEKQDMYRYTKCEVCGKGFVIGQLVVPTMADEKVQRVQTEEVTPAVSGKKTGSGTHRTVGPPRQPPGGADVMTRYQKALATVRVRQKALDEQLRICEQRNEFFEQVSIFECDWEAYGDDALPKRLQFLVDGLRAKIANAHSSIVASTVAHVAASNQAFGTTVGLRDSDSRLYLIARDIVQAGGWAGMVTADKQVRLLNGSIEEMSASLSHYESLMLYYFDLCEEFRGKDKKTARRDRLLARCGYFDERSLPLLEEGKDEAMLLKEREVLEDKEQRILLWLHHIAQNRVIRAAYEPEGSSNSMLLTCVIVLAIVLLILIGIAVSR